MADDMQQVESTLASTERLIARLVTLFEQGGSGTGVHITPQQNQQPPPPGKQPPPPPPPQSNKWKTSDYMHALTTVGNITGVINNNIARLESAASLSLAAQTGVLTSTQLAGKVATQLTGAARNITQFGFAVGGVLTAVDVATDVLANQQRKIELAVARSNKLADIKYDNDAAMRKALDSGVTGAQVELDAETAKRDAADARIANYEVSKHSGTKYFSRAEIAKRAQYNIDRANRLGQSDIVDAAKATVEREEAAANRGAALQELNSAASKQLLDLSLQTKAIDYKATIKALEDQEKLYRSKVDGKVDADMATRIIEIKQQIQQVQIDEIEQSYQDRLTALKSKPLTDGRGNILAEAMREEEATLLDAKLKELKSKRSDIRLDGYTLTTQDRSAIEKQRANMNSGLNSAVNNAKSDKAALARGQQEATGEDSLNALKDRSRLAAIEANKTLKLARDTAIYGAIDPLTPVIAQLTAAKNELTRLESEAKTASGKAKIDLEASVLAQKDVVAAIEGIDVVLAKRNQAVLKASKELELLELKIDAGRNATELGIAIGARSIEQTKRQLIAAGAPAGELSSAENEAQSNAMAKKVAVAKAAKDLYAKELANAEKQNADVAIKLKLHDKLMSAGKEYNSALQAQAMMFAEQAASATYILTGDKPSSGRFGGVQRIGNKAKRGISLPGGAESARLASDFNESYRRQFGKLTDEEKAAAKEERRLNLQLDRARKLVSQGGGSDKDRRLVKYYDAQKAKEANAPEVQMVKQLEEANRHLAEMSGLRPDGGIVKQGGK